MRIQNKIMRFTQMIMYFQSVLIKSVLPLFINRNQVFKLSISATLTMADKWRIMQKRGFYEVRDIGNFEYSVRN